MNANPGDLLNCFCVGPDSLEIASLANGSLVLEWTPESSLATTPKVTISTGAARQASAEGPSPLKLEWAEDSGPVAMPFLVQVVATGTPAIAVMQSVAFNVALDTEAKALQVAPASCG